MCIFKCRLTQCCFPCFKLICDRTCYDVGKNIFVFKWQESSYSRKNVCRRPEVSLKSALWISGPVKNNFWLQWRGGWKGFIPSLEQSLKAGCKTPSQASCHKLFWCLQGWVQLGAPGFGTGKRLFCLWDWAWKGGKNKTSKIIQLVPSAWYFFS